MRLPRQTLTALLGSLLCGCGAGEPGITTHELQAASVRTFMRSVATDVSRDGPAAWAAKFESGPGFFMASDGQLVFADGDAAARGIEALTHALPRIELRFGEDLRVDVLTPTLAMVAASYFEVQTDAAGHEHAISGYFTGLARLHEGHWRLRDAHWSSAPHA